MSQTVSASVQSVIRGQVVSSSGAMSGTYSISATANGTFGSGTGSGNVDQAYSELITLVPGGTHSLDLYAFGGATYPSGAAFTMTRLKSIFIQVMGNLGCGYVSAVSVTTAGTGYTVGDTLTVAIGGGAGTSATLTVSSISGGGGTGPVTGVAIATPGSYTTNPTTLANNAPTGGTGGGTVRVTLTMGVVAQGGAAYVDADVLTVGGLGTTAAWTSLLASNTATLSIPSGTATIPGTLGPVSSGGTGWAVGSSTTNHVLLCTNSGSNPLTYQLVVVGSTV